MADEEAKGKDRILIKIDQRMVNQKDPLQIVIEVMLSEIIEGNRDASDMVKRVILRETAWQKTSICTMRRKMMKMLI